jgi:hypothetical protein
MAMLRKSMLAGIFACRAVSMFIVGSPMAHAYVPCSSLHTVNNTWGSGSFTDFQNTGATAYTSLNAQFDKVTESLCNLQAFENITPATNRPSTLGGKVDICYVSPPQQCRTGSIISGSTATKTGTFTYPNALQRWSTWIGVDPCDDAGDINSPL